MSEPRLSQHYTDLPTEGRKRRRVVSNWLNYSEPGAPLLPSLPRAEPAQGVPAHWSGRFDFADLSARAPLQGFFRDVTDPDNRALIGCRIASRPDAWLNLKACDVRPVDAEIEDEGRAVRWRDLWPECDLVFRPGRHRLDKVIELRAPGHPLTFEFTALLPDGYSLSFLDGGAQVLDELGEPVMRLPAPWARDASTVAIDPDGADVGVTMSEGEPRRVGSRVLQVVRLDVSGDDCERAVYPIRVDPSVVISGTAAIEDAYLLASSTGTNTGGRAQVYLGGNGSAALHPALVRASEAQMPLDGVTDARFLARFSGVAAYEIFRIASANVGWVEGTASGGVQYGSCCYGWARDRLLAWAGGANSGCMAADDLDADASPPSGNTVNGWTTMRLKPAWIQEWASGAHANAGFLIKSPSASPPYFDSTEATSNQPYFEIDYEDAPATRAYYYRRMAAARGR